MLLKNQGGIALQILVPMSIAVGGLVLQLRQETDRKIASNVSQSRFAFQGEGVRELTAALQTIQGCTLNLGTDPSAGSAGSGMSILFKVNDPRVSPNVKISHLDLKGLPDTQSWILRYESGSGISKLRAGMSEWEVSDFSLDITGPGHLGSTSTPPVTVGSLIAPRTGNTIPNLDLWHGRLRLQLHLGLTATLPINYWTQDQAGGMRLLVGCVVSEQPTITQPNVNPFAAADALCVQMGGSVDLSITPTTVSANQPRCRLDPLINQFLDPNETVSTNADKPAIVKFREEIFSQWAPTASGSMPTTQSCSSNQVTQLFFSENSSAGSVTSPASLSCAATSGGPYGSTCPVSCYYPMGQGCTIYNGPGNVVAGGYYRCVRRNPSSTGLGSPVGSGACAGCFGTLCQQRGNNYPSGSTPGPMMSAMACAAPSIVPGFSGGVCPQNCRY